MATAFVQNAWQLHSLRFLLGIAEAGYFPAIIIYLTSWFRAKEQATVVAMFTAAIPVSYVIGTPLSTWIMDHIAWFGLTGWRWMLILEGLPAVIGGLLTYRLLVDRPANARWLSPEERAWLEDEIAAAHRVTAGVRHLGTWRADRSGVLRRHTAWPLLLAGATLGVVALVDGPLPATVLLAAALTGFYAFKAPFWPLPGPVPVALH